MGSICAAYCIGLMQTTVPKFPHFVSSHDFSLPLSPSDDFFSPPHSFPPASRLRSAPIPAASSAHNLTWLGSRKEARGQGSFARKALHERNIRRLLRRSSSATRQHLLRHSSTTARQYLLRRSSTAPLR
ncbi:hypothetical protein BRADI_1g22205v3 [Brachypodium distachyon]|uniref:Uncharacterized protein n=1 Tax=Brachypodium distachyon TaxID=15368 RepID=A0A0Q3GWH9_BRADI|nr:hypothetical protein BRADI_1g22205v3 [Brachypodium distachyon]